MRTKLSEGKCLGQARARLSRAEVLRGGKSYPGALWGAEDRGIPLEPSSTTNLPGWVGVRPSHQQTPLQSASVSDEVGLVRPRAVVVSGHIPGPLSPYPVPASPSPPGLSKEGKAPHILLSVSFHLRGPLLWPPAPGLCHPLGHMTPVKLSPSPSAVPPPSPCSAAGR